MVIRMRKPEVCGSEPPRSYLETKKEKSLVLDIDSSFRFSGVFNNFPSPAKPSFIRPSIDLKIAVKQNYMERLGIDSQSFKR